MKRWHVHIHTTVDHSDIQRDQLQNLLAGLRARIGCDSTSSLAGTVAAMFFTSTYVC